MQILPQPAARCIDDFPGSSCKGVKNYCLKLNPQASQMLVDISVSKEVLQWSCLSKKHTNKLHKSTCQKCLKRLLQTCFDSYFVIWTYLYSLLSSSIHITKIYWTTKNIIRFFAKEMVIDMTMQKQNWWLYLNKKLTDYKLQYTGWQLKLD